MLEGFFNCSIMSRAQKKGLAEIHIHNLRDYAYDRYRKVDDYPFGGFAGMVMKIEPIDRCISALKAEREYDEVIFTSPDGEQFGYLRRYNEDTKDYLVTEYFSDVIRNKNGHEYIKEWNERILQPNDSLVVIKAACGG